MISWRPTGYRWGKRLAFEHTVLCILNMGAHGGAGFGLIPRDDRGEDAAVFLLDKLHPQIA